jgi:acetyl esterase
VAGGHRGCDRRGALGGGQSRTELGRGVTGLVTCGDSCRRQFAIVVSLALRDAPAAIPVVAQWPIYPAADPAKGYPSFTDFGEGYLLSRASMRWFDDCYAPDRQGLALLRRW